MFPACHMIKKQVFEMKVQRQAQALDCQEQIQQVCSGQLEPLLDRICTNISEDGEILHFDRLEVDLGFLSSGHFQQQLVERIQEQLTETLQRAADALRHGVSSSPERWRVSPDESNIMTLQIFLETGRFPWWASQYVMKEIGDIVWELLKERSERVVALLRRVKGPQVSVRLAKQFSFPLQQKLLRALISYQFGATKVEEMESGLRWLAGTLETYGLPQAGHLPDRVPQESTPPIERRVANPWLVVHQSAFLYLTQSNFIKGSLQECFAFLVDHVASLEGLDRQGILQHLFLSRPNLSHESRVIKNWIETELHSGASYSRTAPQDKGDVSLQGDGEPLSEAELLSGAEASTTKFGLEDGGKQENRQMPETASGPRDIHTSQNYSMRRSGQVFDEPALSSREGEVSSLHLYETEDSEDKPGTSSLLPLRDSLCPQEEEYYITNAGLVIVWPFLSNYLATVGLIDKNRFLSDLAKERAVLLLQHLVTGETQWPEYDLLLNKLLCGWELEEPVDRSVQLTESELQESLNLLGAVIGHWEVIKNTSISGFRQSFLQREGRLKEQEHGWHLMIPRTGYDVLLDQLPWGMGFVRLPWMRTALTVEW